MNTKQIGGALLALCLTLAGCGETEKPTLFHPEFDTEDPLPAVDVQNKYQTIFSDVIQEGETFFCGGSYVDGMLLHYYDKESGISGILCGEPSCTHETADCGAKIEMNGGLSYYDGKLYWTVDRKGKTTLYRSDISGRNREAVKEIDYKEIILTYQPQRFFVHRGCLYFVGKNTLINGADAKERLTVMATPLEGKETPFVTLWDDIAEVGGQNVRFIGNRVYRCLQTVEDEEKIRLTVEVYDLKTDSKETIFQKSGLDWGIGDLWVTEQGECYLPCSADGKAVVMKLENGDWTEVMSFSEVYAGTPRLFGGIAMAIGADENGVIQTEVRTLDGKTLYEGDLLPQKIPGYDGDLKSDAWTVLGGDTQKLCISIQSFGTENYRTVLLDLTDGLKPTVLWDTER